MSRQYGGIPQLRGLEIVTGVFKNIDGEIRFGHILGLGTAAATIWPLGGIYRHPSGVTDMTISSDSMEDGAGGTGALTARVTGLDSRSDEVRQTVILDGQNEVALPIALRRAYRIEVLTAGSTEQNVGMIYVGSGAVVVGVPANVFAVIEPLLNESLMTPFTVPRKMTGYISVLGASIGGTKDLTLLLVVREPGEVFRVKCVEHVRSAVMTAPLDIPIRVPSMSDVELRGFVDVSKINVAAAYGIVLIDE